MPSISKEKLDELNADAATAWAKVEEWKSRALAAEARTREFDSILDKIKKAAEGVPLTSNPNSWGMSPYLGSEQIHTCQEPTTEQRQARQIDSLNERVVNREGRLAAVVALTEFAREHKA